MKPEEEGRSDSLRIKASWSADCSLPGQRVRSLEQRHTGQECAASRSERSSLGKPICRVGRDPRHEGSFDSCGDPGQHQQKGSGSSIRHSGAKNLGDTDGQEQRRIVGEVGVHRASEFAEGPSQQLNAGTHEPVRKRLWRSWASLGGHVADCEGFDSYYLRAMRALRSAVRGSGSSDSFSFHLASIFGAARASHDARFKKTCEGSWCGARSCVSIGSKCPVQGTFLWMASVADSMLCFGGNMVLAALNWMHGGQPSRGNMVLTAAHKRVHSRVECALRDMVMTDDPILTKGGLDSFLRQTQHYRGGGAVLALGVRGGVPDRAADVPLADHLEGRFPDMA